MVDYRLRFFIEGRDTLGSVTISKDKNVDDLKTEVHAEFIHSHFHKIDVGELILLKVCRFKILPLLIQTAPRLTQTPLSLRACKLRMPLRCFQWIASTKYGLISQPSVACIYV